MLYVQSWTPDDGRKDRPKHVEWYSINSKIVHLVGFTTETYFYIGQYVLAIKILIGTISFVTYKVHFERKYVDNIS
jgi:hypothetical protein